MTHQGASARESEHFREGWESARQKRYNLAVLGATGVGKSTLINAVFGEQVAATGVGEPVTSSTNFYKNAEGSLGLYDFRGAESFEALEAFLKDFRKVYSERIEEDPADAIHGVWYCIKASDRRFDNGQARIVRELRSMDIPVILVITQTPWKPEIGLSPDVVELRDHITGLNLPIETGEPILVNAMDDDFHGTRRFGLDRLVEVTELAAPEGVRQAFAQSQHISAEAKRRAAKGIIAASIASAAAIAASPIPAMADAPLLVGIQAEMMRHIARIFNVPLSLRSVSSALATIVAKTLGQRLAASLSKLIPGAGNVINATVAAGITGLLGVAWWRLCESHWHGDIDMNAAADDGGLGLLLWGALNQSKGDWKEQHDSM